MFGVSASIAIRHASLRDVTNNNMATRMDFVYITSFDFWLILTVKAFFAAVIGKSGHEKWKVNEPGVFYFSILHSVSFNTEKTGCWCCSQTE